MRKVLNQDQISNKDNTKIIDNNTDNNNYK